MKGMEVIRKLKIDFRDFESIYSACLGRVFLAQSRFERDVVKKRDFKLNLNEGTVSFEDEVYTVQYLGCESNDNIWVWGWDETKRPNEDVFEFTEQIKDFGEVYFAEYAKIGKFQIKKENFARDLTSTISAMFGNYVSHGAKTPHGLIYFAVSNLPADLFEVLDLKSFVDIVAHCAKTMKINHKIFIEGFLSFFDIDYRYEGDVLFTELERKIEIEFTLVESQYKMSKLKVEGKENQ